MEAQRACIESWQVCEGLENQRGGRKMKFPTKKTMREGGIFNPWQIASLTKDKLHISFSPQHLGRGGHGAHYQVIKIDKKTDPNGPWYNYGHKTFPVGGDKPKAFSDAVKWANENFGERDWVKDPWGGMQDSSAVELVRAEVREDK